MITLVRSDTGDWIGLYKDAVLIEESHSLDESRVLQLAGIPHTVIHNVDCDQFGGRLPKGLNDVPHATATLVQP